MKMSKLMDIETAKEMIMDELYQLQEDNKKPVVKFKDIYRNNKQWSPIFFKAGKELDNRNDNIDMYAKYGFHQVELTN
jgi:hypothetical protein